MKHASGPNVRRIAYLDQSDVTMTIRFNAQADGRWSCRVESGRLEQSHSEDGADTEEAAATMIAWLERQGIYVPEPPEDFQALQG